MRGYVAKWFCDNGADFRAPRGRVAFLRHDGFASRRDFVRGLAGRSLAISRPVGTSQLGGGRVKLGENLQNIEQSKIFRDFFDSERSKASQKRTKQVRARTRGSFHTASADSAPTAVDSGRTAVRAKAAILPRAKRFSSLDPVRQRSTPSRRYRQEGGENRLTPPQASQNAAASLGIRPSVRFWVDDVLDESVAAMLAS
jgi:hypothetical protein